MDRTLPVFDFSMPGSAQVNAADYAWNMPPKISELEFNEALGLSNLATNPASTQSSYDAWSLPSFEGTHQNSLAQFEALWKPGRPIGHSISRPEVQASAQPLPLANFADTPSLAPVDSGLDASNPDSGGSKRPGSPMQNARSCERADSSEKAKAINRESQRRFRLRQKARSQAVEHQLASTTAELRELKQRQHQLEVRNMLLEKVSQINKKNSASQGSAEGSSGTSSSSPYDCMFEEKDVDNVTVLTISVQGKQYSISPQEVSQMPLQAFSALWTVYICELGRCLLKLRDAPDKQVEARMQELTIEGISLVGHRLLRNPGSHKDLATGQMNQDQAAQHKLDSAFYKNLLSLLALSDDQIRDLMMLRALYLTKRGLLGMERKALVQQMATREEEMPHPTDNITRLSDLATCLKENAAEDHLVHRKLARAVFRGVLTTKQLAEMMVHCYPYMPVMEPFMHSLAADMGYPSKEEVVNAAQTHPMVNEWKQFNEYARYAASDIFHSYLPFLNGNWSLQRPVPGNEDPHYVLM